MKYKIQFGKGDVLRIHRNCKTCFPMCNKCKFLTECSLIFKLELVSDLPYEWTNNQMKRLNRENKNFK